MKIIRNLLARFQAYHQHEPLMLWYAGLLSTVCFPLFYLLRFTKSTPVYDDLAIRLMACVACALLLLRNKWPRRLTPLFFPYAYAVIIFSLPFAFMYISLKNGGGPIAVGNTLMAVFFVILVTDWRNMIVMVVAGFGSAILLYATTDPNAAVPLDYVARLPILLLVLVGGSFFKIALERATAEKVRNAYASLAGSIAHEMRNPLGQIKHSLEQIQQALPIPTAASQHQPLDAQAIVALYKHLAQGQVAVARGLQVIAMTLDEVNSKPLNPSGFVYLSAAQACEKAVQEYGYESDEQRRRVRVQVDADFVFRIDETAFLFVLFNLIKNALFYLPAYPHSQVVVTIGGGMVKVRDNGPGISPDSFARLFEPFNTRGKSGGTGLGLAYCQRVMRAFGGTISCESVQGDYTLFVLAFPPVSMQERESHRQAVLTRGRGLFEGRRLLLVDDDAAQRTITRHKLLPLGSQIDEVPDGLHAMALLSQAEYDLVVLDLNMPALDGYAVARHLREGRVPANQSVRIVAYTSEPAHLAQVKTRKAGIDGFVSKPCDQVTLVLALCQALCAPPVERGQAPALAGRAVLLADDNEYNRKAVAAYLKHAGASVAEVNSGAAAVQMLGAMQQCDAILLDLDMPGMSGLEAAQAIRTSGLPLRHAPIVALTAHSGPAFEKAARDAGMEGFMTKPIDAQALCAKLNELARPAAGVPQPAVDLLDLQRLEGYLRIGMLEELVSDYLPQVAAVVDRVEQSALRGDFADCSAALHSLVGMSGEMGANRLHLFARSLYITMVEDATWPVPTDWTGEIQRLSQESDRALRAFAAPLSKARA